MRRFLPQPLGTVINLRGPRGSTMTATAPDGSVGELHAPHGSVHLELRAPGEWTYSFPGCPTGTITVLPTAAADPEPGTGFTYDPGRRA
jgi:hypothetical protein